MKKSEISSSHSQCLDELVVNIHCSVRVEDVLKKIILRKVTSGFLSNIENANNLAVSSLTTRSTNNKVF